jgi:hypothetical protein
MNDGAGATEPERAARFFEQQIDEWLDHGLIDDPLDDDDNTPAERMQALVTTLARHLKLVKIDLEATDNAQVIFETLNGRGERLTDPDLIRNLLFRRADEEGQDSEAMHAQHWAAFDDERWTAKIAHGRHQRDRLHLFLNHWLSMRTVKQVPASSVFKDFKGYLARPRTSAADVAADIAAFGRVFDGFDAHPVDSTEWWFFRRINEMDLITVYPVLLYLFGQPEQALPITVRRSALHGIESFLVRRLIRRDSTRSYGDLFVDVLKVAAAGDPSEADARIIELLASKTADADRWPTDDEMRSAVLTTNVYKLKQSRLKMVLEGIERHIVDDGRTEKLTLANSLWIEHLLPQTWRGPAAWALPADSADPTQAAYERDHMLHTMGNLTLTTSKLDIELSNRPWNEKVQMIGAHSALALNRAILQRYPTYWNEDTIRERGKTLAEHIVAIWPSPGQLLRGS